MPLAGSLLCAALGRRLSERRVGALACGAVGLAFLFSLAGLWELLSLPPPGRALRQELFTWVAAGGLEVRARFLLDPLSATMALVVSGVAFFIHLYSVGYMAGERGFARYFSFLNLFTFFMLLLVLADNFLVLFVGWEGVGLSSYLLIGFWYERPAAAAAAKKAFVVNRVGDAGFLLALLLIHSHFGTLDYGAVFGRAREVLGAGSGAALAISLLLFAGATGKSAQIPLYVWLPDAMEGPTPVSALIHAATMVTAGVYMVARTGALFALAPLAMGLVAAVGLLTALWAAAIALAQVDIKRVLAYSTISQLGLMFLAAGVGAPGAAIFHLMTHAFFKALLFLSAGSVIHALGGEQDLRKMGGLKAPLPTTYLTFLAGAFALSGVFPFAGFFSKDQILLRAYGGGGAGLWMGGALASVLTSLYIFRLFFLIFHGRCNVPVERQGHIHEAPPVMALPLRVLAVLSLVGGFVGVPLVKGGDVLGEFLAPAFAVGELPHVPLLEEALVMLLSLGVALLGIFLAHSLYLRRPSSAEALAARHPRLHLLLRNKFYVDELYSFLIGRPLVRLSEALWRGMDVAVVDGAVNGVGAAVRGGSRALRLLQTGYIKSYALSFLVGLLAIVAYIAWR